MRVTYQKNYYGGKFKYVCPCGYKFKRMNRDWFTINPFNTKPYDELMAEGNLRMSNKERNCPKCGLVLKPEKPEGGAHE